MGGGGMYPLNNPYSTDYMGHNYPYYNQGGGYPPSNHIPPHVYPPNHVPPYIHPSNHVHPPYGYPPHYGRGYQRPYYPTTNDFHHGVFPNQLGGRGFLDTPRTGGGGGHQSAPPSTTQNGNLQMHRPGEHR